MENENIKVINIEESVPVIKSYDIIVAGAGVAGVAAALSARRRGMSVLLIEKSLMLGGLATLGLVNLFVPMCNGRGKQIIKGMAEEFLRLSIKYGYDRIPSEWEHGEPTSPTTKRYTAKFSAPIFALALTELLVNAGVELMYDTVVSRPLMRDGHACGVIVENKSGRECYEAKYYIDATGDGDLLYRAGVPMTEGKNYFTYIGKAMDIESCEKAVREGDIRFALYPFSGGEATLYGGKQPEGRRLYTGTTEKDVTEFTIENQLVCLEKVKQKNRKRFEIISMPGMPQFRTTRHINGNHILNVDDKYRHSETSIGAICDFDNRDYLYEVPYGCLVKDGFDNLITAGRIAGAAGYAWDVLRVIPPAIITGQAAGEAAALAVEQGCIDICKVDIEELQKRLAAADVMIHFDDSLIPKEQAKDTSAIDEEHM